MSEPFPAKIGKYEVRGVIGEGGFGLVYKAYDPTVGRPVALKVMTARSTPDLLARFQKEAIAAGNLRHENIVTIYEFGVWEGAPYIAMEFLDGLDLSQLMSSGQTVSLLDKVRIMTQVGEGLQCAHEHGVVHRDVKPANIKVLPDGSVKMMDFGIARLTREDTTRLTQQGDLVGTIRYMSPEQFAAFDVDALCDIFAYGVIYYEFLAGTHPFEAPDMASFMYKITGAEPVQLSRLVPGCPRALNQIVMRAIEKDRDLRYQSLEDLLLDSRPVLLELQKERAAELLTLAHDLFSSGEVVRAQASLKEILDLDPNNPEGWELRERIQQSLHRTSVRPKIATLLKAAENDLSRRQFPLAIESLESAQKLDPNDSAIARKLAEARLQWDGAIRAERLLLDATREFERKNLTLAERLAAEALNNDPANSKAADFIETVRMDLRRRDQERRLKLALDDASRLTAVEDFDAAIERLATISDEDDPQGQAAQKRAGIHALKLERARQERLRSEKQVLRRLLKESRLAEALPQLESLVAEFPEDRDLAALLADTRQQLAALRQAEDVRAAREQAGALQASGQFAEAEEVVRRLAAAYPGDSEIGYLLQEAERLHVEHERREKLDRKLREIEKMRAERRFEDARSALDAARREFSDDQGLIEEQKKLESEWEAHRRAERARQALTSARTKIAEGSFDSALLYLKQAFADDPQNPEVESVVREARRQAEAQRANRAIDQACAQAREMAVAHDFDAAIAVLQGALQSHPGDPRIEGLLDAVSNQQREWESQQRLREALRTCSQLIRERRYPEAIHALEVHLKTSPEAPALLKLLAQARAEWESARRSEALAQAISEIQSAIDQKRLDEAMALVEHHSREFGGDPAFDALRGQVEESARKLERERRIADAESQIRALLNQGNRAAALQVCQSAMARDPDAPGLLELFSGVQQRMARDRRETEVARLTGRARQAIALRDWNAAGARLDELRAQYPGDPALPALDEALRQERRRHETEVAFAALEDAIQRRDWPRAEKQLAATAALASDSPRIADARGRIESGKRRDRAVMEARTALKKERFEEAERLLAPVVSDYPGDGEASDLLRQAQSARAAADADVAVRQGRKQARSLAKELNFDDAIRILRGLVASYGSNPEVERELSQVMLQADVHRTVLHLQERRNAGDAKTVFEGATQILNAGDSPEARELLDWSRIALARKTPTAAAAASARLAPAREAEVRPFWKKPAVIGVAAAVVVVAAIVAARLWPSSAPRQLVVSASSVPRQGTAGRLYSGALTASGGMAPYQWSVSASALPPGLSLDAATGAISGTPAGDGTFDFAIRTTDHAGHTLDTPLSVLIGPKTSPPPGAPLELAALPLAPAVAGENYKFQMQASGGTQPYHWSMVKAPAALTIDDSGTLSGKPSRPGNFDFEVRVGDSAGQTARQTFTLSVASTAAPSVEPPQVTTTSLPEGTVGTPYSVTLRGDKGKPPYTWSVSGDPLPPNLKLDSTGQISGVPSAAGRASLTIRLSDADRRPATSTPLALVIKPLCPEDTTKMTSERDTGDPSGSVSWRGVGLPGQPVVIVGNELRSGGSLISRRAGNLRGAPVDIKAVSPDGVQILEKPEARNGWKCIAFQPPAGTVTVSIDWVVNWGR